MNDGMGNSVDRLTLFFPLMSRASSNCEALPEYHDIWGGGDPPTDEQVRLSWRPSVAWGDDLTMVGDDGFSRTVTAKDWERIEVYQNCITMH